jgi:hypothetical protein
MADVSSYTISEPRSTAIIKRNVTRPVEKKRRLGDEATINQLVSMIRLIVNVSEENIFSLSTTPAQFHLDFMTRMFLFLITVLII